MDPAELRRLVTSQRRRNALKREYEQSDQEHKELQARLWSEMEDDGEKTIKIDLGEGFGEITFVRKRTVYSRIIDAEQAAKTFEDLGEADIYVKRGFDKKRLNELVRTCLEHGTPIPDGIDFYSTDYISIGGIPKA